MDILSVPEIDRQLIAVVDDDDLPRVELRALRSDEKNVISAGGFSFFINRMAFGLLPFVNITFDVAEAVALLTKKLKKRGGEITPVGKSQVGQLVFPPGHPRLGGVYAIHPAQAERYYPVADFHRLNFESKCNEATRLLMALGANKIVVRHVTGWQREFAAGLTVAAGDDAAINSSRKARLDSEVLFEANLQGSAEPRLPSNLVWFDHEPNWQAVAEGRLERGLEDFSLTVSYNDDYGINGELKAQIANSGLRLSGSFAEYRSTIWNMSGSFGSRVYVSEGDI